MILAYFRLRVDGKREPYYHVDNGGQANSWRCLGGYGFSWNLLHRTTFQRARGVVQGVRYPWLRRPSAKIESRHDTNQPP